MKNSKQYYKLLKDLTKLLSEGYNFRDKIIKEYLLSFSGFVYVVTNIFRIKLNFQDWKKKVEKKLNKHVPNSRYIAYFNHPKYTEIKLPDIKSNLINYYYSKFETYFIALQDVIWHIKEEDIKENLTKETILALDLKKATLRYKNKKPITVSLNKQAIKLLKLLLDNYDNTVEYKNIAKHLGLNAYYDGVNNSDIAREVNYVRKSLVKELKRTGMNGNEINKYIVTIKGIGYKATLTT